MDYHTNSRRSVNRRPCNPGCDCDSTCGMPPQNIMPPRPPMRPMPQPDCGVGPARPMPTCTNEAVNNDCMQGYPVGMCYVPWQKWPCPPYDLCRALQVGTIFPDLDKPFLMGRCARL